MFDTITLSKQVINLDEYRDKVLGCWTGKNIGGTLGAPFECKTEMNDITFYTQDLGGSPAPNDDLDLQLVWLLAVETEGLYKLSPRLLGEYWMNYITAPPNEYGVCKSNIANGLYPPLSGSCNNDAWKYSNGAWIRSEFWACLFPGSPDDVTVFAYMDACCDHCGEGIYAELFTASMQSAAFIMSDVRQLIEIGLSKIPKDCRVARSVNLVCDLFDKGVDFKAAREAVVKDNEDLGWMQAPGNLGFVIIGLLYGKGDFGKSICLAANCGDDTDCTAATVGATLTGTEAVAKRVWRKSPYALSFDLPFAEIMVDYENGPIISEEEEKRITVSVRNTKFVEGVVYVELKLPTGWRTRPAASAAIRAVCDYSHKIQFSILPVAIEKAFTYVPLEVRLTGRFNPAIIMIPFQLKNAVSEYPQNSSDGIFQEYYDKRCHRLANARQCQTTLRGK
ncbi:MAG: ADP-ribosylglycohydrolase family protein [Lentisphaerae bacterium]|nr:ADP-ribosylglycohydrolase family protein [Lentisphaerota bacterium]